jgi:transcriptional regulator NrdR family protein
MRCTKCKVTLPVIETRKQPAGVYRRRKCQVRGGVVTTLEQVVADSIAPIRAKRDKRVGAHTPR